MLFNTARTRDCMPALQIVNILLEAVEQSKLLGVQITSNLKWNANPQNITKIGYTTLWVLKKTQKEWIQPNRAIRHILQACKEHSGVC